MRRIVKYLRPYKWQVASAVLITLLMSGLGPLQPYLVKIAIDNHILKNDYGGLVTVVAIMLVAVILQALLQYLQAIVTQWIGQQTIYDLRKEIMEQLQRLSLRFFDKNPVGRLVTRITSDVEVLNELFSSGLIMVFADVFVVIGIFAFMFLTSWKLALVVTIVLPMLIGATSLFAKKLASPIERSACYWRESMRS